MNDTQKEAKLGFSELRLNGMRVDLSNSVPKDKLWLVKHDEPFTVYEFDALDYVESLKKKKKWWQFWK